MIDMHAHICTYEEEARALEELAYRSAAGIHTWFSTGTPGQYQVVNGLLQKLPYSAASLFSVTFGIHPWFADQWDPADWTSLYRSCPVIGEIGMDSLWCDVPLKRQEKVFETQLAIAADLKKPVVLHTKDCEQKIAQIIKDHPYPILVHWYSGDCKTLRQFLDQGCYFTLGPDADMLLLQNVPADHMFVETDGLDAILWARNTNMEGDFSLIAETLNTSVRAIARQHSMSVHQTMNQLEQNLNRFLAEDISGRSGILRRT